MTINEYIDLDSMENQKVEALVIQVDKRTEALSNDPQLFRKKIDMVNQMGLAGERLNIGCVALVYDSALVMSQDKPRTLSGVIAGSQGTGKSATIKKVGQLYPASRIFNLAKITPASLFRLDDKLCHKTLVIEEATHLINEGDAAATIRTLISEGKASYQKTGPKNSTVTLTFQGPISFLTTTIALNLEAQLGDRLIKISPDESHEQTLAILRNQAIAAAGRIIQEDSDEVLIWKIFHENLQPLKVVVPFACEVMERFSRNQSSQSFPVATRRAFDRMLNAIMAMTVTYQSQREIDTQERLVAEIADYAMVRQLIEKSFVNDIGMGEDYADKRLMLINDLGKVTISKLAEIEEVSPPAISEWAKLRLKRGILVWCDSEGKAFKTPQKLTRAKNAGEANLRIPFKMGLPTPYDLTEDSRWQEGGELYELYDLKLDDNRTERPSIARIPQTVVATRQLNSATSFERMRNRPNLTWINKYPMPAANCLTGLTQETNQLI